MDNTVSFDITVKGFVRLGTEKKCRDLIDVLTRHNMQPLKYGTSERPRKQFCTEDFVAFWVDMEKRQGLGIPFIKGNDFHVSISWGGAKPYHAFIIVSNKIFPDINELIRFTKDFYYWNDACYGYAKLYKKYSKDMSTPGLSLRDCLGGITWANLFGKPYVDMWGIEKLLKAPTWRTERLDDGGFLLITTESPTTDRETAEEAEEKLKLYLGEKYFYQQPLTEERLSFEGLVRKMADPPRVIGYAAPDFGKYYDI